MLIELGVCVGAIGRRRTFIVYDREKDTKIPSDLAGVTPATFQEHETGNLQAALGAPCTQIKEAIRNLGPRSKAELTGIIDQDTQFLIISDLLGDPANQFFIQMFETSCSFQREGAFGQGEPYECSFCGKSDSTGHFSINSLCQRLPEADLLHQTLREQVLLTERGRQYAAWLIKNERKSDYFWSRKGSWGTRSSFRLKSHVRKDVEQQPNSGDLSGPERP